MENVGKFGLGPRDVYSMNLKGDIGIKDWVCD